ncbi:FkbM family methyltransferase [Cellulomonas endometrii]|uniref:FkbM family methyltransferase n=1 Tax=Cellulomonas endometrii TaxID=3036301 RepID=UPI0024AD1CE0|nr:FkbM family methyltransferase [Cellulomonas endometrii]
MLERGTEERCDGEPKLTLIESDAGPLWLHADDGMILPFLRGTGTWEPEEGGLLRRIVRDGATFVDVGANVGYFSRLIARHCRPARIIAFEPHPLLVPVLRRNVAGAQPPVEVHALALGDAPATVELRSAPHNIGDTRVARTTTEPTQDAVTARMSTFDDEVRGRVDVVKIDVQGYELDVLRGMRRVIAENPQLVVVAEFWPGALEERGLRPAAVLAEYRAMGFETAMLRWGGPVHADDGEIFAFARSAGPDGQANLVLRRPL